MAAIASVSLAPVAVARPTVARSTKATKMCAGLSAAPKGLPALFGKASAEQKFAAVARKSRAVQSRKATTALQATSSMEVFEVANMVKEITQVSVVMFFITLIGLAIGFVLLRVEAIVEEN
jgi:hypothetical protein